MYNIKQILAYQKISDYYRSIIRINQGFRYLAVLHSATQVAYLKLKYFGLM